MSADLRKFAQHARKMAERTIDRHDFGVCACWCGSQHLTNTGGRFALYDPSARCSCEKHPPTPKERELWARLADEAEAFLARNDDEPLDGAL